MLRDLERRFAELTLLLYDTSVPPQRLDEALRDLLAEDVRFTDPWQRATGKAKYRLGAAGFHCMFRFRFELRQVTVSLDGETGRGRALVDGIMQLEALKPLFTYPLRTILAYDFTVDLSENEGGPPSLRLHDHEEMWSLADLLEGTPVVGALYNAFRATFSVGFLAASRASCRLRTPHPPPTSQPPGSGPSSSPHTKAHPPS